MNVYVITTNWNETYTSHGSSEEEAIQLIIQDSDELQREDIAACRKLALPIQKAVPHLPDGSPF